VHESLRLFVAMLDADDNGEGDAMVFINPEITVQGDQTVEGWEGCLSIPDIRGRVPRAQHIVVTALDRHGKRFELELRDFAARVVQHETDHLDGVLFFDRMKTLDSLTYLEEFSRYHARREDDD
jgi:peptide deformylase